MLRGTHLQDFHLTGTNCFHSNNTGTVNESAILSLLSSGLLRPEVSDDWRWDTMADSVALLQEALFFQLKTYVMIIHASQIT